MNEKKRVLVMEDDPKIAAALSIRLTATGYDVRTVPNGFDGLKLALRFHPDLLLMDIWMPVGLGFSVAQRLQSMGLGNIPIIFITASKLSGLKETAENLGAFAFFEKPYDSAQVLAAVAKALAGSAPCMAATPCA
jgi:CheY-like chemotaxis protein